MIFLRPKKYLYRPFKKTGVTKTAIPDTVYAYADKGIELMCDINETRKDAWRSLLGHFFFTSWEAPLKCKTKKSAIKHGYGVMRIEV